MNKSTNRPRGEQTGADEMIIQVTDITKKFTGITAVAGISFDVKKGEVFGFLGPNGAGKTTTINILTGLARPDSGTIQIAGFDCVKHPKAAQHLIGVVPDESNLYPELTGFDNLCFCAALYGMKKNEREERARELLQAVKLEEAAGRKFGGYSRGMKRKLTIAAGIIHSPLILFLDEPTSGIDIASARQIRQMLAGLRRSGTTIFLTTHYIEEAERLCDRIAFISGGKIVRMDSVANLLQPTLGKNELLLRAADPPANLCGLLAQQFTGMDFSSTAGDTILVESGHAIHLAELVRFLEDQGVEVLEAARKKPSLEDVFVEATGIEADAMKKEKEKTGSSA